MANLANIYGLGSSVNQFNVGQSVLPYQTNLPNYSKILGAASGNALANAQGIVDQPTQRNLINLAAERGIAGGHIGDPNANAALMQALGRGTQQTEQLGLQQFGTLMGLTPQVKPFDPQSMFVDPASMQTAQYIANLLGAMPNPRSAALTNLGAFRGGLGGGGSTGGFNPSGNPLATTPNAGSTGPTGGGGVQPMIPSNTYPNIDPAFYDPSTKMENYGGGYGYDPETGMPIVPEDTSGLYGTTGDLPFNQPGPVENYDYSTNIGGSDLGAFDPNYNPFASYTGDYYGDGGH